MTETVYSQYHSEAACPGHITITLITTATIKLLLLLSSFGNDVMSKALIMVAGCSGMCKPSN